MSAALESISMKPMDRQPSIAVLPFANMGAGKESEYFSDGLAEEMINFLAQIPGLKVTARTSAFVFKDKTEDIRKIAAAMGVATILEGSVRRSGSRLRVTAQLITWSQRYDRDMAELFDLQDEIAQSIASALQVKLAGTPAPYKPTLPAYEALLKARYCFWNLSSGPACARERILRASHRAGPEILAGPLRVWQLFLGLGACGSATGQPGLADDMLPCGESAGTGSIRPRWTRDVGRRRGLSRIRLERSGEALPPDHGARSRFGSSAHLNLNSSRKSDRLCKSRCL